MANGATMVALWSAVSVLALFELLTLFGVRRLTARLKTNGPGTGVLRGTRLPDVDVRVIEGGTERRDTLRGLVHPGDVLAVGSVTCPACQRLWEYLSDLSPTRALEQAHGPLYVLMSGEGAREHAQGLPFPLILDEDSQLARTLGVQAIPTLLLLDRELRVSDEAIAGSISQYEQFTRTRRGAARRPA